MEESNEVREKKKRKIIDVRRKELEKRIRKRVGEGGRIRGTRMRKVDREVYTVRRDLINPPKLLSLRLVFLFLTRKDALCSPTTLCSRGRGKFRVMACFDRNERSFLYDYQSISCALFISYAWLKSCRVKSTSIVRVPIFQNPLLLEYEIPANSFDMYSLIALNVLEIITR